MNNKLQLVKGKTELKFYHGISNYYVGMTYRSQSGNFQFEEDVFSKIVQGIGEFIHEV